MPGSCVLPGPPHRTRQPMLAHRGHWAIARTSPTAHSVSGVQRDMPVFEVTFRIHVQLTFKCTIWHFAVAYVKKWIHSLVLYKAELCTTIILHISVYFCFAIWVCLSARGKGTRKKNNLLQSETDHHWFSLNDTAFKQVLKATIWLKKCKLCYISVSS